MAYWPSSWYLLKRLQCTKKIVRANTEAVHRKDVAPVQIKNNKTYDKS